MKHALKQFPYLPFISLILIVFVSVTLFQVKSAYTRHTKFLSQVLHKPTDILGASTDRVGLNINFSKQIATGSPLVFGGASNPNVLDQDAWDLLASVGITSIRRDFWMETEVPKNITLADYKANKNNVQDPKNWNWSSGWNNIDIVNKSFQNAQKRGMKTIAILTYAPAWLTYSGSEHGVPKDWDVYRDLVKKLYKIHRPYIDMMEVWNEPTYTNFLVLTGSPYKTRGDAYKDLYINATRAIREVDTEINDGKQMPIIGVVGHTPMDTSVLESMVSSPQKNPLVSAVSYHNYHIEEPSNMYYKEVLKKAGKENIPIYLTEWNLSPDESKVNPYHTSNLAIAYTGKKLIGFLNEGLAGANYFAMNQNDPSKVRNFQSAFGFYRKDTNGKSYLLPQGRTWQVLSKSLGLGAGQSQIFDTSEPPPLAMTAFINNAGQRGIALANDTNTESYIAVSLQMLGTTNWDTIKVYAASATQDGKIPCTLDLIGSLADQSLWITLPPQSVVGLTISTPKQTVATMVKKVLGATSSTTCALLK